MVGSSKEGIIASSRCLVFPLIALFLLAPQAHAQQQGIDEMSLERWAKLREVERHQMQIAEKYFREKSWKVAAAEFDKYLTLYEASDAASYALLKWSICQVNLRRQNTAIDDGFRSVVDYWPDSPDAVSAAYYVGKTYLDIGQVKKAKVALKQVVEKHPKATVGVYAMVQLVDIAGIEKDEKTQVEMWKRLTFDAARTKQTSRNCVDASVRLSSYLFANGDFATGVEALETTYKANQLPEQVVARSSAAIRNLLNQSETKSQGEKLAEQVISYLEAQADERLSGNEKERATDLYYLVANVQRQAARDSVVMKTYEQIEKKFGKNDRLLGAIAGWHRSQQDLDKARQSYKQFENKIEGLSQIAATYIDEKNVDQAVLTYSTLAKQDADNASNWLGASATAYRQFGMHEAAVLIYEDLMRSDVENASKWLWETASTYRDWGKYKEAIGYFRQSENFPSNYREMALCQRRLKQGKEAVILYNQIAAGDKGSAPWALIQVGYTEEESGNKDRAIAAFKKVCKLFPKDRHASQAHAHLQNKYKLTVTLGGAKDDK